VANNHYLQIYSNLITSGLFKADTIKKVLVFSTFFYALIFSQDLLFAGQAACPPQHINESARVNHVYDGDTVRLEDGRKVRLIGIDTPEVFSKKRAIASDIKDSGERAKAALQKQLKLTNNRVSLSYGKQRFDRYGRTLAHVFLSNGRNLQAWLISKGYAIAFTIPPNDKMSHCYIKQELLAQQSQSGIWQMTQYQVKRSYQLSGDVQGLHRLQGKVSRVLERKNRLSLILDEKVELNIYKEDLYLFNKYQLSQLQNKAIRVRGWVKRINRKSGSRKSEKNPIKYRMTLRHPDSLNVDKVIH